MKSQAYMPTSHHMNLATWHTINSVYSQKSQLALGSMRYDIEDTQGIDRLFKLIEQRAGHWLAMEVEETKIQLTHTESRHLPMDRIEPGLSVEELLFSLSDLFFNKRRERGGEHDGSPAR